MIPALWCGVVGHDWAAVLAVRLARIPSVSPDGSCVSASWLCGYVDRCTRCEVWGATEKDWRDAHFLTDGPWSADGIIDPKFRNTPRVPNPHFTKT